MPSSVMASDPAGGYDPSAARTASANSSMSSRSGRAVRSNRSCARSSGGTPGNISASRYCGPRGLSTTARRVVTSMTALPVCTLFMPVSSSMMIWAVCASTSSLGATADSGVFAAPVGSAAETASAWMSAATSARSETELISSRAFRRFDFSTAFEVSTSPGRIFLPMAAADAAAGTSLRRPANNRVEGRSRTQPSRELGRNETRDDAGDGRTATEAASSTAAARDNEAILSY
mmetsp:Transcript_5943/g.12435  ORF Transcript_5943/g.12435 Transcript_5943/m.12435 type:complete len:233 (+) Transcript_5943:1734-2432(+)